MPQLFETERKVIVNNYGSLGLCELWHYLGERVPGWPDQRDIYLVGSLREETQEFWGEDQIPQSSILGYLDDHLEFWNDYIETKKILNAKILEFNKSLIKK